MWKSVSRARLIGAWFAAVMVMLGCRVAGGTALPINTGELWWAVGLVPPAVMLLVWRGAPPVTVAELRYSVTRPSKEGQS